MRFSFRTLKSIALTAVVALGCLLAKPAQAGTTNLLAYNNYILLTNGAAFLVPNVYLPPQRFLFQNGGLTNLLSTNLSLQINIQVSIDAANSNWITIATYNPAGTNAIVDSFNPTFNAITLPMRCQVVVTNPISVATFVQQ